MPCVDVCTRTCVVAAVWPSGVHCSRGQHMLGVDVSTCAHVVASVLPSNNGTVSLVCDNGWSPLHVDLGAQGPTVHWPSGVHCPRGQHMLGVDVCTGTRVV